MVYLKCDNKFCEYAGLFASEDELKQHKRIHDWHKVAKYDVFDNNYAAIRDSNSNSELVTDVDGVVGEQLLDEVFGFIIYENQVMTSKYNLKHTSDYIPKYVLKTKFNSELVKVVLKKLGFKKHEASVRYYYKDGYCFMYIYKTGSSKDAIICQCC